MAPASGTRIRRHATSARGPSRSGWWREGPPSRRQVLLTLLASAATLPALARQRPDRVIVVGAGVSGLTLAHVLGTAGVRTVVLEARERIGGRVWPGTVGAAKVDLGGMWVSGVRGNPVAELLEQAGVALRYAPYEGLRTPMLDGEERVRLCGKLDMALRAGAYPGFVEDGAFDDHGAALEAYLEGRSERGRWRTHLALHSGLELSYGAAPHAISTRAWEVSLAFRGGEWMPPATYQSLLDILAEGTDVRTGTEVSAITHDADGVTVQTSTGTFHGSHAVVTVPLGVLRAGTIHFDPPLSASRQAAIDALRMGTLEKTLRGGGHLPVRQRLRAWRLPERHPRGRAPAGRHPGPAGLGPRGGPRRRGGAAGGVGGSCLPSCRGPG